MEATDEELANAATKIGSVYRGKKAREEVAQMKADKAASGETPADGQADAPAQEGSGQPGAEDPPAEGY